jgi:hypothetical protein
MVSEDSQNFGWSALIHRLRDFGDHRDAMHPSVFTCTHQIDDLPQILEARHGLPEESSR